MVQTFLSTVINNDIEYIKHYQVDVNVSDEDGITALIFAIRDENVFLEWPCRPTVEMVIF